MSRMDIIMDSCELVSLSTAIACGIAKSVSKEDLPLIAAVLGQVGSTLATIAVQEGRNNKEDNVEPDVVPDSELITIPTELNQ